MVDTTNIEKKSLEAHVELCAERYNALEVRLDNVNAKIAKLDVVTCEVRDLVQTMADKRTDQLIGWGLAIIGSLAASTVWLLTHYVFK
jgi:hypothetical protein